ncbi:MAG: antibiotic biosynthesis monooxygenase [Deinococcota bacterium]|nr:antibiotic biosynthesis monooxygenase [Deinococcota bacterium]
MPIISVTRLRLRSANPLGIGLFFWHTFRSARQAETKDGFLGGKLLNDAKLTFWTVTVWESEEAMRKFRNNGDHQRAMRGMKALDRFCSELAVVTWQSATSDLPGAATLYQKLVSEGRSYKLSKASDAHSSRRLDSPTFRGGRRLKPRQG